MTQTLGLREQILPRLDGVLNHSTAGTVRSADPSPSLPPLTSGDQHQRRGGMGIHSFDALVLVASVEADLRRSSSVSAADTQLAKATTPVILRADSNGKKRKTSSSSGNSSGARRASEPTFRTAFAAMNLAAATAPIPTTTAAPAVVESRPVQLPSTKKEIERLLLDTARQRQNPLVRSVTRPESRRGVLVDVSEFLALPQSDAAETLGLPTSTLSKRWKEIVPDRKWPYRTVMKIDHAITSALKHLGEDDPPTLHLRALLQERHEALVPISIRISRIQKLNMAVVPAHIRATAMQLAGLDSSLLDDDDDDAGDGNPAAPAAAATATSAAAADDGDFSSGAEDGGGEESSSKRPKRVANAPPAPVAFE